jgi:hypothetical protein
MRPRPLPLTSSSAIALPSPRRHRRLAVNQRNEPGRIPELHVPPFSKAAAHPAAARNPNSSHGARRMGGAQCALSRKRRPPRREETLPAPGSCSGATRRWPRLRRATPARRDFRHSLIMTSRWRRPTPSTPPSVAPAAECSSSQPSTAQPMPTMTVTATRATVVIGSLLRFRRYWFEVASCVMTQFCGRPPTGAAGDVSPP